MPSGQLGGLRLQWLRSGGPALHQFQSGSTSFRNAPAVSSPFDQALREDFQTRQARREPRSSFRPIPPAGSQNGDVPLDVRQTRKAVGVARQHLEYRHLKVHCQPTRRVGRLAPIQLSLPNFPVRKQALPYEVSQCRGLAKTFGT